MPFHHTPTPDPHPARGRRLAAAHPELHALNGRNPWTAALGVGLVGLQFGTAIAIAAWQLPAWAALLAAWTFGAFVAHALLAVMHETAHGLVFRSRRASDALLWFVNAPLLLPFGTFFSYWHLEHHRRQGDVRRDPDLPRAWELRWFATSTLGKWIWHALFLPIQILRVRAGGPRLTDPRVATHVLFQLGLATVLAVTLGASGLLYLTASLYFLYSLHPLAGRFIQEHHPLPEHPTQETASYVGPLNYLSLNFGLHTEHHDFPAVPWNRLPAVRRIAPEGYTGRVEHRSWTWTWLRFLLDPRLSPASRIIRDTP